jgi:hypothetical protein
MRSPRTGEGSMIKRKLLEQGPVQGLVYKRTRLEPEKDGATAPVPRAGAQGAYSYKPQLMTVALQRSKPEASEANNKAAGWRPAEDDAIMIVQTLLKDPRFVLTTYAVNKLPENAPATFGSVGGRSAKKVRDRFEYLTFSGKYAESVQGRIAAKIRATQEIIAAAETDAEAEGAGTGTGTDTDGDPVALEAREAGRLQRIMSALDHLGTEPDAETATAALRAKERAAAILSAHAGGDGPHSSSSTPSAGAAAAAGTLQAQTRHSVQVSGAPLAGQARLQGTMALTHGPGVHGANQATGPAMSAQLPGWAAAAPRPPAPSTSTPAPQDPAGALAEEQSEAPTKPLNPFQVLAL